MNSDIISRYIVALQVGDDEGTFAMLSDVKLLIGIGVCNEAFLNTLKEKGVIDKSVEYQLLKIAFQDKGGYLVIFEQIFEELHFRGSQISLSLSAEVAQLIREFYETELRSSPRNIEEEERYFDFFKCALLFFLKHDLSSAVHCLIYYADRVMNSNYDKAFKAIAPRIAILVSKLALAPDEKVLLSLSLVFCFATFDQKDGHFDNAFALFSKVLEDLKDVDIEKVDVKYHRPYNDFTGNALNARGACGLELAKYNIAFSDLFDGNSKIFDVNARRDFFRLNQILGLYHLAEVNLLSYSDVIKNTSQGTLWEVAILSDKGRYFLDLGYFDDAILFFQNAIRVLGNISDANQWLLVARRNLGIALFRKFIDNRISEENVIEAKKLFEESISMAIGSNQERFNALTYIWLARYYSFYKDMPRGIQALQNAQIILQKFVPFGDLQYFEYYLTEFDLGTQVNPSGLLREQLQKLLRLFRNKLGSHHPLIRELLLRMRNYGDVADLKSIDKYQSEIEGRFPHIRIDGFVEVPINQGQLLQEIQDRNLALLPKNLDDIKFAGYQLTFFKSCNLICCSVKSSRAFPIKRYFIENSRGELFPIIYNSFILYTIAETSLDLSKPITNLARYIRFFFDAAGGRYGAFYLIESIDDIQWSYPVIEDQILIQKSRLSQIDIKEITFLYSELVIRDEKKVQLWHFSCYILFIDSLFFSKVEVTEDGEIKLYSQVLLLENLPIFTNIQSQSASISHPVV